MPGYALDNGDVNGDGDRDLIDALGLLRHMFLGAPAPVPLADCAAGPALVQNGDANGNGSLEITDALGILTWLFIGSREPVPACGEGFGAGGNPNPRVIPPQAKPFGKSYGFWAGDWWRYVFEVPVGVNPLVDETGANCAVGQPEHVWYLSGKLCLETTGAGCAVVVADRSCTVPAGRAIFFPTANSEWDNLGVDPPFSEEELKVLVSESLNAVTVVRCEVDGVAIQGLDPPDSRYRVATEKTFSYNIPEDNIFSLFGFNFGAQTVSGAVAEGYYIMLAPLSKGSHTVHYFASFDFGFELDVTYHLTVE